ncbi:MAG: insulinase family protein [Phycisphaeraceae bacterium]|nr:insulinase family protein [Phycisphaeraceae bacterium]
MPIDFKQHTLSNGLTILAEVNDDAHTAAVGFFVKTGARDETPDVMGVSHFLEHMMFKGTAKRSAEDVNREFDEIGANYNAFTSHEQTVYYAHTLPEVLPSAVDLFADMLRPSLRGDDFDTEKQVILEEIGMYDDRPEWRLQDRLLEEHYGEHGLGYRVLGTTDTVSALTAEQMRAYFNQRYSPDNLIVSAAGRLDFGQLCTDLEERCGGWSPTDATRAYTDPSESDKRIMMTQDNVSRQYLAMLCPGPSAQDELRYPSKVLADVLGDSDGSRLYWALVDPGLADEADFSFWPHDQTGAFMAYASCDPGRSEAVEAKLLSTLDGITGSGFDINEGEVQRAINKLVTRATLQGERPAGRMQALGAKWMYHGRYVSLDEELDHLLAVKVDGIAGVLDRFSFKPRTVVTLGPKP